MGTLIAWVRELDVSVVAAHAEWDQLYLDLDARQVELEAHCAERVEFRTERDQFKAERDAAQKTMDESESYFQRCASQLKDKHRTKLDACFVKGMRHECDMCRI